MDIQVLAYDRFETKNIHDLSPGDLFLWSGRIAQALKKPKKVGDEVRVSATPLIKDDAPITIMMGDDGSHHIVRIMDLCLGELTEFGDGTVMITDVEHGATFSPRLSMGELEAFCKEHMFRYEDLYLDLMDDWEPRTPPQPWWDGANEGGTA